MALICGDYQDENGKPTTIIPLGRDEHECIEMLRETAQAKGISISVRREPCKGEGFSISTIPQSPSIFIGPTGVVRR